ncbi:MAG: hypothetical protein PHU34_04390 [Candidatus Methanoperedens sp.]|nr:hypothetical protein [Candidatus Methanoperedens sp.]
MLNCIRKCLSAGLWRRERKMKLLTKEEELAGLNEMIRMGGAFD